jgi:hypothetical protein
MRSDCPASGLYCGHRVEELRYSVLQKLDILTREPHLEDIFTFIKQEPHKRVKADTGSWRLISGVSCTDQLVAIMCAEELLDFFIDNPMIYKTAIGWGFCMEGGIAWLKHHMPFSPIAADKSAWDWTVQPWIYELFAELMDWFHDDEPDFLRAILRNHIKAVETLKVFDAAGLRVAQPNPGIVASGWAWTIFFNCLGQIFLHFYADVEGRFPPPLVMGDDTVQEPTSDSYWDRMKRTGALLKEIEPGPFFCGIKLLETGFEPVYMPKYCYNFHHLSKDIAPEVLSSYQWLFAYLPKHLNVIHRWMRSLGVATLVTPGRVMRAKMEGQTHRLAIAEEFC